MGENYRHKTDYHIHSEFSGDSTQDIEELVQHCISIGLTDMAITDHMDYDTADGSLDFILDLPPYMARIAELKDKYKGKITIRLGTEFGAQQQIVDYHQNRVKGKDFDFIILSGHNLNRVDLYYMEHPADETKDDLQDRYFANMLRLVQLYDTFSVVGHMDYVTRYGGEKYRGLNYDRQRDIIDEILRTVIHKGKGLEINTSGFRYGEERFYPDKRVLKRYFELGGEILTIGSDAHVKNGVAAHFDDAYEFLDSIGVHRITVFDKMKPIFVNI